MSELVISTAPAPQPFPLAEAFVICLMVFGAGVLTGMIVAFGISGQRRGNPRAVVNLAGAGSVPTPETHSKFAPFPEGRLFPDRFVCRCGNVMKFDEGQPIQQGRCLCGRTVLQ